MVISDYSIRNKSTVFVLMFVLFVTGVYAYFTLPREATPDIEIPYVIVTTSYRGVSPADIENTVTVPLERELKGLSDVKEMKSTSAEGSSVISLEFNTNIEMEDALRKVKDKVDKAKGDLPAEADDPVVVDLNMSEFPIMILNISGHLSEDKESNLLALKTVADELETVIKSIPGVLDAKVVGGLTPEVRVELDPDKLAAYRVPAALLVSKYLSEDVEISGGNTAMGKLKYDIRVPMEFERNFDAAYNVIIQNKGPKAVYLADMAKIVVGFEEESSCSRFNSEETVSIIVQKQTGKNILFIAGAVKHILEEARKTGKVPKNISLDVSNDISDFVKMAVDDLDNNILSGFVLVVLVILIFLGFRNSIFVGVAIPFSILMTLTILAAAGITMNMIVLFALVLSVGMLVDNAIVIVENIYRHQQEGYGRVEAAMKATGEVAWPVITSTLTTVAAFAPLLFWSGIMGEFMSYLPLTVIIALMSSLFVALVINPTLCAAFMKVKQSKKYAGKERPLNKFMRGYRAFLRFTVTHRKKAALVSFSVLILTIAAYAWLGKGMEFFPSTEPKEAYVDIRLPEGSTLDATDAVTREIEKIITELDIANGHRDVKFMVATVGSQGSGGHNFLSRGGGVTPNIARVSLEFVDIEERRTSSRDFVKQLREKVSRFAGVELEVQVEKMGPPSGAPVNVEISGEDYDLLAEFATMAKEIVKNIPGVVDLKDDLERGRPELRVTVDRTRAALLDLNPMSIGTTIKTAYRGAKVGVFRIGDEEYDVNVIADEKYRKGFSLLDKLYISTNNGQQVPASTVARWDIVGSPGIIRHIDQKRVVTISGEVEGRLSPAVRDDLTKALQPLVKSLPEGYGIRLTGEETMQQEGTVFLTKAFAIGVMLIALILIAQFNSFLIPVIILSTVVLSTIGALFGLIVMRMPFSVIMTGIGIISLAGVVVNNTIVLIDYNQKLRTRGLRLPDALVTAGMTRLRPVFLTAITTVLGLIPLVIGVSFDFKQGNFSVGTEMAQMWGNMAVAVAFGLTFATVLTLVMVPTFLYIVHDIGRFVRSKIKRHGFSEKAFGSYVVSAKVVTSDAAEVAERVARESGKSYQEVLSSEQYLGGKTLLSQLSDFTDYPLWEDLSRVSISNRFRDAVPRKLAEENKMVGFCSSARLTLFGPVGEPEAPCDSETIYLAVCEPLRPEHVERVKELARLTGVKLIPVLTTLEQVKALIERTYASG